MHFYFRKFFLVIAVSTLLSACFTHSGKRCEPSTCLGAEKKHEWTIDWVDDLEDKEDGSDHDQVPGNKFKIEFDNNEVVSFSRKQKDKRDYESYLLSENDPNYYIQEDNMVYAQFYFIDPNANDKHVANFIFYLTKPSFFKSREFVFRILEVDNDGNPISLESAHGRGGGRGN